MWNLEKNVGITEHGDHDEGHLPLEFLWDSIVPILKSDLTAMGQSDGSNIESAGNSPIK